MITYSSNLSIILKKENYLFSDQTELDFINVKEEITSLISYLGKTLIDYIEGEDSKALNKSVIRSDGDFSKVSIFEKDGSLYLTHTNSFTVEKYSFIPKLDFVEVGPLSKNKKKNERVILGWGINPFNKDSLERAIKGFESLDNITYPNDDLEIKKNYSLKLHEYVKWEDERIIYHLVPKV